MRFYSTPKNSLFAQATCFFLPQKSSPDKYPDQPLYPFLYD